MKRIFSKGDDISEEENIDGGPTFGINMEYTDKKGNIEVHGNAIEVYTTEKDRDLIIKALNSEERLNK